MPEPRQPGPYRYLGRVAPEDRPRVPLRAQADDEDTSKATIRLYDAIDSWGGFWGVSASEFGEVLDGLSADVQTIDLRLNSPGGDVFEGIAILNLLRSHPATVVATVDGIAASAASFIAAGCDELVMGENTELMIHDAWGLCVGNAADMRDVGDRLDKVSNNIAGVYAKKAGGEVGDWRARMLLESWYNPQEAVEVGLADRVAGADEGDPDEIVDKVRDSFDLSVFSHAGRADAPAPDLEIAARAERPAASLSAYQTRRHRMVARRHGLTA